MRRILPVCNCYTSVLTLEFENTQPVLRMQYIISRLVSGEPQKLTSIAVYNRLNSLQIQLFPCFQHLKGIISKLNTTNRISRLQAQTFLCSSKITHDQDTIYGYNNSSTMPLNNMVRCARGWVQLFVGAGLLYEHPFLLHTVRNGQFRLLHSGQVQLPSGASLLLLSLRDELVLPPYKSGTVDYIKNKILKGSNLHTFFFKRLANLHG